MKRFAMIILLGFMALAFASADQINLGDFPVGEWVDSNYDAVWNFSSNNIQLYLTDGTLVFDFQDKVEDFKVSGGLSGLELSFSCPATSRSYKFVKGINNLNLKMMIDKNSGVHYEVEMKMK